MRDSLVAKAGMSIERYILLNRMIFACIMGMGLPAAFVGMFSAIFCENRQGPNSAWIGVLILFICSVVVGLAIAIDIDKTAHTVYRDLNEDVSYVEGALGNGERIWIHSIQMIRRVSDDKMFKIGKRIIALQRSNLDKQGQVHFSEIEKSILKETHARFRKLLLCKEDPSYYIEHADRAILSQPHY